MSGRTRVLVLRDVAEDVLNVVGNMLVAAMRDGAEPERLAHVLLGLRAGAKCWNPAAGPAVDAALHLAFTEPTVNDVAGKWMALSDGQAVEVSDVNVYAEAEAEMRRRKASKALDVWDK